MSEDEKETKTGFSLSLRELLTPEGKKNYWWLPFAFIFLFLIGGGFYAVSTMRQSAQKLVGGEGYTELSANSALYNSGTTVPKTGIFMDSEEESLAAAQQSATGAAKPRLSAALAAKQQAGSYASVSAGAAVPYGADSGERGAPGHMGQSAQSSMSARLQAKGYSGGRAAGGISKTSGQVSRGVAFQQSGSAAGVTSAPQDKPGAGAPKRGGGGGILESLRSAFRASVYGARTASQDSAKGWIARSFDATPEATTTVQYNAKMKAELDTVNPNSIPNFLRDQDLSAGGAKTLKVSAVSKPGLDEEATRLAAEKAAEENPGEDLFSSMFGSFGSRSDSPAEPAVNPADDGEMNNLSDPDADPNARADGGIVDEFGYISYGDPNGFQTIFDSEGNQLGCTDNAKGFCIPFGAPGCT